MAPRPSEFPRWATGGTAEISAPSEAEKDAGHIAQTILTAALANWLQNTVYQWLLYLDGDRVSLTTATTPPPVQPGTAAAVGVATEAARADHVHDVPTAAPAALTVGGTQAAGIAATVSRADHVHAMPGLATTTTSGFFAASDKVRLDSVAVDAAALTTEVPVTVSVTAGAPGVETTAARADHVHGVSTAGPVALTVGGTNTPGVASTLARADHKHALPAAGTPVALTLAGSSAAGAAATLALSDHVHALPATAAPAALTVGGVTSAGSAATLARSDHAHAMPGLATIGADGFFAAADKVRLDAMATGAAAVSSTAPTQITVTTAAAGVATVAARGDHVHSVSTAAPAALAVGGAQVVGSATSLARSDHQHAMPGAATTGAAGFLSAADKTRLDGIATGAAALTSTAPAAVGTAAAVGGATVAARGDHVHAHGAQTDATLHATATTILAGFMAPADKVRLDGMATGAAALSSAAPTQVTVEAANPGVATVAARGDHVHSVSTAAPVALTVGGANAAGAATSLARSDHTHALPAFGATAGTFAQGSDARLSDDRVGSGLRTATTVVAVSSAAAPAAGAVLTATGPAAAGWQMPLAMASSTPAVVAASGAAGVATTAAHSDHAHAHGAQTDGAMHAVATTSVSGFLSAVDKTRLDGIATGAAAVGSTTPIAADVTAAAIGVATTAARSDHRHQVTAGSPVALTLAAATADGSSTSLARADHVHALPATAAAVSLTLAGANAAGSAVTLARSDHVHALPATAAPAALTVGAASSPGASTSLIRADHVHAMPGLATPSVDGFQSAADKSRLDALRARSYFDVRLATATTLPAYTATTISTNRPRLIATANGVLSIDGAAVVAGDLVLVLFEVAANCGVYEVIAPGTAGTPYQLDLAYSGAYTAVVSGSQMIVRTGAAGVAYCNREFRPSSIASGRFAEIPGELQVWPRDQAPPTTIYPGWLYEIDALGSPVSLTLVSPAGAADVLSGVRFGINLTDSGATVTITPTLGSGSHINGPADTNINATATTFAAPRCATLQWVCGRGYTLYSPDAPYWRPVAAVADAAAALGVGTTAYVMLGGGAPTTGAVLTATSATGAAFQPPAIDPSTNGFRLSPTSDDSPAADGTYSTIYLAPVKSDRIALYDTTVSGWRLCTVNGFGQSVSGRTAGTPFDVFISLSAAAPTDGTAAGVTVEFVNWTSPTARATAITRVNGVWTKSAAPASRYLGTCNPRSATTYHMQTVGNDATPAKCDLWNVDNQISAAFRYARSWTPETFTHPTANTWVGANGASSRFEFVQGVPGAWTRAQAYAAVQTKTFAAVTGVGFDTVSTPSGTRTRVLSTNTNDAVTANGQYSLQSPIGAHYLAWIIWASNVAVVWWGAQSTHESGLEVAFQC